MKSKGLREAIKKAGGVNSLGRKLGISGQAVQQWTRVPAERIVEVERITGVARARLRPDLYQENSACSRLWRDIERERA